MSLVQKSWTLPARRVLGRLMRVSQDGLGEPKSLQQLRNPVFGGWTHAAEFSFRFDEFEAQLFKKICEGRIANLRSLRVRVDTDSLKSSWINTITNTMVSLPLLSHIRVDTSLPASLDSILPFAKALSFSLQPLGIIAFTCQENTKGAAVVALKESKFLSIFPHLLRISSLKAFHFHIEASYSRNKSIDSILWRRGVVDGRPDFVSDTLELSNNIPVILDDSSGNELAALAAQQVLSFAPVLRIPFKLPAILANALFSATNVGELHVDADGNPETSFLIFSNAPRSVEYLAVHVDLDLLWKAPSAIALTRITKWVDEWKRVAGDFLGESMTRRCPELRELRIIFHYSHYPDQENRRSMPHLEGEKLVKWQRQIDNISKKVSSEISHLRSQYAREEIAFEWDVLFDERTIQ